MNKLVIVIKGGTVTDVLVDGVSNLHSLPPEFVVIDFDLSNSTQATEIPELADNPIAWKGAACVTLGQTTLAPEYMELIHQYTNEMEI